MNNIKTEIIPNEIIKNIKHYRKPNYGSDTTCYILNKDCVIKLFNPNCNILEKLFLTQETYGNDTYLFVSTLVLNEQEKLIQEQGVPVKGKENTSYIAGVLCENLNVCVLEAKKVLPKTSLGESVQLL